MAAALALDATPDGALDWLGAVLSAAIAGALSNITMAAATAAAVTAAAAIAMSLGSGGVGFMALSLLGQPILWPARPAGLAPDQDVTLRRVMN